LPSNPEQSEEILLLDRGLAQQAQACGQVAACRRVHDVEELWCA